LYFWGFWLYIIICFVCLEFLLVNIYGVMHITNRIFKKNWSFYVGCGINRRKKRFQRRLWTQPTLKHTFLTSVVSTTDVKCLQFYLSCDSKRGRRPDFLRRLSLQPTWKVRLLTSVYLQPTLKAFTFYLTRINHATKTDVKSPF